MSFSHSGNNQKICLVIAFILFLHLDLAQNCVASRKLNALYKPNPLTLSYHNGGLLEGKLHVSIIWYGNFSPSQKSIIVDFLLSLSHVQPFTTSQIPTVSRWWGTIQTYMKNAGKNDTLLRLTNQVSDHRCSVGKFLKKSDILQLTRRVETRPAGRLTLVLTADDVTVEGFCMSKCGFHGSGPRRDDSVFIWVGNSVSQCPGQCAWPFHQPIYGPQTEPLVAPNGDVGVDGMIVNIATLLGGAVTNPYGNGYFVGSGKEGLEVGSACTGVYGEGAYPGYGGRVSVDRSSGGSYNAVGVNGRKYLLPALFDPLTSKCSTLV